MRAVLLVVMATLALAVAKPLSESSATQNLAPSGDRQAVTLEGDRSPVTTHLPQPGDERDDQPPVDPLLEEGQDEGQYDGQSEDLLGLAVPPEEEELGDEELMGGAETMAFRPLFVHRQREARRRGRRAPEPQARRQRPYYHGPYRPVGPRPAYLRPHREGRPPLQILY